MSRKMNQVLAVEKGIKQRVYERVTELHKVSMKAELLNGFTKTYERVNEDSQEQAPQAQRVQFDIGSIFAEVRAQMTEHFDVTATKDWGNVLAKADVVVEGKTLLTGVPATHLLFLDKQLSDLHKLISSVVELDPSVDWDKDVNTGRFRSRPQSTQRTEKKQKPLVLFPATDKHPAQTQLITEDIVVGNWQTVRHSGAIPAPEKKAIVARVEKLMHAVKSALEQANMVAVEDQKTGDAVFGFIFG